MLKLVAIACLLGISQATLLEPQARTALTAQANALCTALRNGDVSSIACNANTGGIFGGTTTFTGTVNGVNTAASTFGNQIRLTELSTGVAPTGAALTGDAILCSVDSVTPSIGFDLRQIGISSGFIEVTNTNGAAAEVGRPRACGSYIATWARNGLDKGDYCLASLDVTTTGVATAIANPVPAGCRVPLQLPSKVSYTMIRLVAFAALVCYATATSQAGAQAAVNTAANNLCTALKASPTNLASVACNSNGQTFTYVAPATGAVTTGTAALTAVAGLRALNGGATTSNMGCDVDSSFTYISYSLQHVGISTGDIEIQQGTTAFLRACGGYTAWWIQPNIFDPNTYCLNRLEVNLHTTASTTAAPTAADDCGVAGFPA